MEQQQQQLAPALRAISRKASDSSGSRQELRLTLSSSLGANEKMERMSLWI
jgi:hypothetical protein